MNRRSFTELSFTVLSSEEVNNKRSSAERSQQRTGLKWTFLVGSGSPREKKNRRRFTKNLKTWQLVDLFGNHMSYSFPSSQSIIWHSRNSIVNRVKSSFTKIHWKSLQTSFFNWMYISKSQGDRFLLLQGLPLTLPNRHSGILRIRRTMVEFVSNLLRTPTCGCFNLMSSLLMAALSVWFRCKWE